MHAGALPSLDRFMRLACQACDGGVHCEGLCSLLRCAIRPYCLVPKRGLLIKGFWFVLLATSPGLLNDSTGDRSI
jgi:hypothetical protein